EYLNAWIVIHILKDKFGWQNDEAGFIFNLSVGYNLEGIKKPNVQWFFDKMNDCSEELNLKIEQISSIYPHINEIKIPTKLSDNITLSTMHGCPPEEIENIVEYLITERKFHTAVKLNPTLLGKEKLHEILNTKLVYETVVPNEAFEHDLKWDDAVKMIERLTDLANKYDVEFGLKLTNTLESINSTDLLPQKENMVYMSGRALHPISINLAAKLQKEFNGKLDVSFSAGVDAFNVADTLACNIKPITVCSDLLKPGGYTRLAQYITELRKAFKDSQSKDIEQLVLNKYSQSNINDASIVNIEKYADQVLLDPRYKKETFKYESIKTNRSLTAYDCIHAPCIETCAISQDVPEYMYHTSKGNFTEAFKVIEKTNPLPNITGMVCDHLCQAKCTRINYDSPLLIREIKRFIAEKESQNFKLQTKPLHGVKAAVIGAGPAGLSAAYFLALEGVEVHLYETKSFAGGMAADAIPIFRIDENRIKQDIANIKSLGVKFHYNTKMDADRFNSLHDGFNYIFIAVGAQSGKRLNIEGETIPGVYDQLTFLADVLKGKNIDLGKNVAIIGGGLSAVDAARTAKRLAGERGKVKVLYRRTKKEMPCGREEIDVMIEEGIEIVELTSPEKISEVDNQLNLKCSRMELGEIDSSGRRHPVKIEDSEFDLEFDSIITAIGQDTKLDFFPGQKLMIDKSTLETQIKNVFTGGDAVRGADSLINA
ncbi:MAG: FAD-dependent oxidoreductase, partial [Bacteroidota bacterium]